MIRTIFNVLFCIALAVLALYLLSEAGRAHAFWILYYAMVAFGYVKAFADMLFPGPSVYDHIAIMLGM